MMNALAEILYVYYAVLRKLHLLKTLCINISTAANRMHCDAQESSCEYNFSVSPSSRQSISLL